MSLETLSDQVSRIIAENQNLRIRVENDAKTIRTMTEQYDDLAAQVDDIRNSAAADCENVRVWANREVMAMQIERDQAVRKFEMVDTTLKQAADLIMQAARAAVGDLTPEKLPERKLAVIKDDRLPATSYG